MAEPFTTSRPREAPAAEAAARLASRRKTAGQRLRILERLTMGLSVAHRAQAEPLTARWAPQLIAEMLARRETDPPAGFVQLQGCPADRSDDPKNRIWPVPVWRRIGHFQWDDPGSTAYRRSPHG